MQLLFTPEAKARLVQAMGEHTRVLLSLDDGVGPFSSVGYCSLETAFDLIIVDQDADTPDYDVIIDSDIGPVAVKGYSQTYMAPRMQLSLNETFQTLQLTSDSEQLDPNVQIKVMTSTTN